MFDNLYLFGHGFTQQAQMRFKCKEITDIILKSFYEVYNEPGDGFTESVHENALLLNFGRKPEFKRFVYDNKRKISVMISVDQWLNSCS